MAEAGKVLWILFWKYVGLNEFSDDMASFSMQFIIFSPFHFLYINIIQNLHCFCSVQIHMSNPLKSYISEADSTIPSRFLPRFGNMELQYSDFILVQTTNL